MDIYILNGDVAQSLFCSKPMPVFCTTTLQFAVQLMHNRYLPRFSTSLPHVQQAYNIPMLANSPTASETSTTSTILSSNKSISTRIAAAAINVYTQGGERVVVGFSKRYAENKQGAIADESYGKDGVSPELPPKSTASQIPPTGLSTHPLLPRDGRMEHQRQVMADLPRGARKHAHMSRALSSAE